MAVESYPVAAAVPCEHILHCPNTSALVTPPAVHRSRPTTFISLLSQGSFPEIVAAGQEVVEVLRSVGSGTAIDIDELLQRQALDVISRVGFGIDLAAMQVRQPCWRLFV